MNGYLPYICGADPRFPFENEWLSRDPLDYDEPYASPDEWGLFGMISPMSDYSRVFREEKTKRIDLSNCLHCQPIFNKNYGWCLHTAIIKICCVKCAYSCFKLRDIADHHKEYRHLGSYYAYTCQNCSGRFCSNSSFKEHLLECIV